MGIITRKEPVWIGVNRSFWKLWLQKLRRIFEAHCLHRVLKTIAKCYCEWKHFASFSPRQKGSIFATHYFGRSLIVGDPSRLRWLGLPLIPLCGLAERYLFWEEGVKAELSRMREIRIGRGIVGIQYITQLILWWTQGHLVVVVDYLVFEY